MMSEIKADFGILSVKGSARRDLVKLIKSGGSKRLLLTVTLDAIHSDFDGTDQEFSFSVGYIEELKQFENVVPKVDRQQMSENLVLMQRIKGPVEILCKEIDYPFSQELEKSDLFIAFVRVLVSEIDEMRTLVGAIALLTGKPPSEASGIVLERVRALLDCRSLVERDRLCAELHRFIDEVNPDEAYPTDHLIDMLNSCVSAVRFGLEIPCRSRHAASAAGHVWEQRYGVTCQDAHTGRWKKDWARAKFQDALVLLWLSSLTGASTI